MSSSNDSSFVRLVVQGDAEERAVDDRPALGVDRQQQLVGGVAREMVLPMFVSEARRWRRSFEFERVSASLRAM